jgi:raffinose/stachyose/melibiose transport system substrate-binding protein
MIHHPSNKEKKMKVVTKRRASRLVIAMAIAYALVATPLSAINAAERATLGARCETAGVTTGTSASSLVCVKGSNGKQTWQRVKLSNSGLRPVGVNRAPAGSIEFHHWRPEDKDHFQVIIDKFEAANPGVKVVQQILDSPTYTTNAFARIRNNSKAAIFVTSRGGQFNDFYAAGLLADISREKYVQNNVIRSFLAPGSVGGKVYGVPYQSLYNNPLYNTEMFAKNGWKVPKNWTEILAFCKTAKAAGVIPFAWPAATRGNAGQIINAFLMNSNVDSDEELATRIANIESGKEDLQTAWFKEIANKYKAMYDAGCFPANVSGYNDIVAPLDFALGKAAIYPTGSFALSTVLKNNPAMTGKVGMFGLITTDGKVRYEGVNNPTFILSVNAKATSRDQQIARAFMSYLLQAPLAQQYAISSGQQVTVVNVDYAANQDMLNMASIATKKLILAPRFLFNNVNNVRNPVEDALIAIGSGGDVNKILAETSATIKQNIGK